MLHRISVFIFQLPLFNDISYRIVAKPMRSAQPRSAIVIKDPVHSLIVVTIKTSVCRDLEGLIY